MKRVFFVTGLPRSRTAWLANYLTFGNSFCHHEICRKLSSIEDMPKAFAETGREIVGTADSGFLWYHERALELFPNAAIAIVSRNAVAACASFSKFIDGYAEVANAGEIFGLLKAKLDGLGKALYNRHVLEIDYKDLSQANTCRRIWDHCTGEPWDYKRWAMLDQLNVQVKPSVAVAEAVKNKRVFGTMAPRRTPAPSRQARLHEEYNRVLNNLCGTTPGAYLWMQSLWEVLLTWDHIEDNDALDKAMASRAFEALLIYWPQNPFFLAHRESLLPVMFNAISAWRYANAGGAANKGWDFYTEIPTTVAAIIGGMARVNEFMPVLRGLACQIHACDDHEDQL